VRQLYDFKHAARTGKEAALMIPVVVGLTQDDMLNLAAYLSSRQP
jgi:cytochrome c553